MEATTSRLRPSEPLPGAPSASSRLATGTRRPVEGLLGQLGDLAAFSARAFLELGGVWRYTAEVLRQAALLITGTALLVVFMEFVMGTTCGTEGSYILRGYGATIYSGVLTSFCTVRDMSSLMFAYIVAAKVGCGLAAEIGSMRINEELDAMEAQGINPMRYVVATRLLAAWIAFPLIFLIGLGAQQLADYLVVVKQIGEVSRGGWEGVHWAFQDVTDYMFTFIKAMVFGTQIVLVAMYFGYRAKGGPVGVGAAVARSMTWNLVVAHFLNMLTMFLFWGLNARTPIGG